MDQLDQLYIEIELSTRENAETEIFTTIPSFTALYVYLYLEKPKNIKLNFVLGKLTPESGKIKIHSESLKRELTDDRIICKDTTDQQAILDLRLPVYSKEDDTFIAGTCSVCREIILRQSNVEKCRLLLGFKESCLLAPSESSIWTRFCEVNIVQALGTVLICVDKKLPCLDLPVECVRFENHMKEPVRMHNIYKLAREKANDDQVEQKEESNEKGFGKKKRKKKVRIECSVPKEQLDIKHVFAEGTSFTIADLILYPCLRLIFHCFSTTLDKFPLTKKWLNEVDNFDSKCRQTLQCCIFPDIEIVPEAESVNIPSCDASSLYKSDPKRYKPRNRIFTEQKEVDGALSKLLGLGIDFRSDLGLTFDRFRIDWLQIEPSHAESSALPIERLVRKRQQLENLANAVISLTSANRKRIVDFCSGTGHLGILLALQLPQCTVTLLENKPISLQKAKQRAKDLNLKNINFYQCNIDYFEGNFDVGTSLHACGTATDIVLQQCLRAKANFVSCPCCYGSLQPMPHIRYPLSKAFRSALTETEYTYIAHTADQAHALGTLNCSPETTRQGQLCMDIVDTDRKLQAQEAGYRTILTRLKPENCTPKNRLLVGEYKS